MVDKKVNVKIEHDKLIRFIFTDDNIKGDESILQTMIPKFNDMSMRIARIHKFGFNNISTDNIFKIYCDVNVYIKKEGKNKQPYMNRQFNITAYFYFDLELDLFTSIQVMTV
jgi:hypothetical protein